MSALVPALGRIRRRHRGDDHRGPLLGFGFGWALIATSTVGTPGSRSGWAFVPAGAMGATGAALVVFTPGNQALTAMSFKDTHLGCIGH